MKNKKSQEKRVFARTVATKLTQGEMKEVNGGLWTYVTGKMFRGDLRH